MALAPRVRAFELHEWRTYRDLRLQALADAPDAFGSTLRQEQVRTDREWAERLETASDPRWNLPLLACVGTAAAGLAWGRIEPAHPERADLYQMWADPEYRGLGVGNHLLDAVIDWARDAGAAHLALCVTCGDTPATRLYARAGFVPVGDPEPLRPGSPVLAQAMRLDF